ncbi:hypothetical protein [Candidatus Amarobacter glycogenicus]|nr:hypothetical protein [Dehalococcoidia bacterium]
MIARKGIELAIETLARLADPRNKLVITHQAGMKGWRICTACKLWPPREG